ncbi:unnamed protein product [Caenorhabditis auriculariae]|uniref:DUF19 domain-containing protein n=1 Tax=Caenorhabditis auriculariae TaxID=2777116 RepID=A0A8S1HU41_9PELO|nr:unnamed protein product [Caenorhabditis auriculariae]
MIVWILVAGLLSGDVTASEVGYELVEEKADFRQFCERYVECAAVALLEERLCLGNSRMRPFWLPAKRDPNNCHEKLKNDYIALERLEEESDSQMSACLLENFVPLDGDKQESCTWQVLEKAPRFTVKRRSIAHVPTNCFAGVQKRVERECGPLAACCSSLAKCTSLNSESNVQKIAKTTRENMRKRAADCEKGLNVVPLQLEHLGFSSDEKIDDSLAPFKNLNVRFHHNPSKSDPQKTSPTGLVNVRFSTGKEDVEGKASRLLIRKGDVSEEEKTPSLDFPEGGDARIKSPKEKIGEHTVSFTNALKKTNDYKEKLRKWDRSKQINQELDSLLDAAQISTVLSGFVPMGTVTPSSSQETTHLVLSNPVIMFPKEKKEKKSQQCEVSKSEKLSKILALLGEKANSSDMRQIRTLLVEWESEQKRRSLTEKQQKYVHEVENAMEELLRKFDNIEALRKNATLDDCQTLTDDNGDTIVVQQGVPTIVLGNVDDVLKDSKSVEMKSFISDDYKKEIEAYRKEHQIWGNPANTTIRNETTCDMYMRCRNQMNLAVDSCAWRFASDKLLATMAESAESLLYKDDAMCAENDEEAYVRLYEGIISRNRKLRLCLDKRNEKFFEQSVCMAYSKKEQVSYDEAMVRLLFAEYKRSSDCFDDANLIQTKCMKLRECCPNFDKCREETMDSGQEMDIISTTAHINERKHECIKSRAKDAFKQVIRELLTKGAKETLERLKGGRLGVEISRGARVVRMIQHRE